MESVLNIPLLLNEHQENTSVPATLAQETLQKGTLLAPHHLSPSFPCMLTCLSGKKQVLFTKETDVSQR